MTPSRVLDAIHMATMRFPTYLVVPEVWCLVSLITWSAADLLTQPGVC